MRLFYSLPSVICSCVFRAVVTAATWLINRLQGEAEEAAEKEDVRAFL